MELWFDGRSVAVDYTVPSTLNLKKRTPGLKYVPLEVQTAAQNLKISKYGNLARNKNHEFVPLVAESLGGLGGMAVKLFGEIARAQASSRHPVGHILRRLIDIDQPDRSTRTERQLSKTSEGGGSMLYRRPFQQLKGLKGPPQVDGVNNSEHKT